MRHQPLVLAVVDDAGVVGAGGQVLATPLAVPAL